MKAITDVVVVGDEYEGLLAAICLKVKVPQLRVRVVRYAPRDDFRLEGLETTPAFLKFLHEELAIAPQEFLRSVRPTWGLGARYHWGPRGFFDYTYEFQIDTKYAVLSRETGFFVGDSDRAFENIGPASALMSQGKAFPRGKDGRPQITSTRIGYHIERDSLVRFLQTLAQRAGVVFLDGKVTQVLGNAEGISCIELDGGELLKADIFIDATGSQSLLLGQTLGKEFKDYSALLCDQAIVATWARTTEPILAHCIVQTMEAGWSWRSDYERFVAAGYAFCSRHTDAKQAEAQLRAIYPQCGAVRLVKMQQGQREAAWCANVIGIGNAAALVEPLAAAGPALIAFQCQWFARTLIDCEMQLRPTLMKQYNKRWQRLLDSEREFLGLFYRFNTRLDSPFWQEAREKSHIGELDPVLRCYQDIGPDSLHRNLLLYEHDPFGLEAYFSVLVGQKVPWTNPWKPPAEDLVKLSTVCDHWRRVADQGFTVTQTNDLLIGHAPAQGAPPQRPQQTSARQFVAS